MTRRGGIAAIVAALAMSGIGTAAAQEVPQQRAQTAGSIAITPVSQEMLNKAAGDSKIGLVHSCWLRRDAKGSRHNSTGADPHGGAAAL